MFSASTPVESFCEVVGSVGRPAVDRCERRRLGRLELVDILVEVEARGFLEPPDVAHVHHVQVERQDLILAERLLELDRE